ncbi:uncharacterized protein [Henckelia pumila]|uniref:uncharacterized protein n=1 Tax=Henckelia pumila TaxID=405737 RepID=UPI003C6E824E
MANDWKFYCKSSRVKIPLISILAMTHLLRRGAEGFLVYAVDVLKSSPELSNIPVVKEFAHVFPDEVPGFPPTRDIEFSIELMPGNLPISKAPYKMEPLELKELKEQLEYLLAKGYIRPNACEKSFVELKRRLTSAPVLTIPSGKSNAVADGLSRKVCNLSLSTMGVSILIENCCASGLDFEADMQSIKIFAIQAKPELLMRIKKARNSDQNIHSSVEKVRSGHQSEYQVNDDGLTDGQSEWTIRTLEDILRAVVLDFGTSRQDSLPLVEFSYNNSYQASIEMTPFEALYGKKCRSPLFLDDLSKVPVTGPDMIRDMSDKIKLIQSRMRAAQDRQAKYSNVRCRPLSFEQGDRVFLKIYPFRGTTRFGKRSKLSPRYIGPYEILDRIDDLAYILALPPALSDILDVFHVSMLKKYQPDPSHVLQPDEAELNETLN